MIYAGRCYKIIAMCGMSFLRMDHSGKSKIVGLHVF